MFVSPAAAQALEPSTRFVVERVREAGALALLVPGLLEVVEEAARRPLLHLLPRRAPDREVGGDEVDLLAAAVLCGEPLEQRVGVRRVADGERPDLGVGAGSRPRRARRALPSAPRTTRARR